eukprot:6489311-Amphidinium_carterae.1
MKNNHLLMTKAADKLRQSTNASEDQGAKDMERLTTQEEYIHGEYLPTALLQTVDHRAFTSTTTTRRSIRSTQTFRKFLRSTKRQRQSRRARDLLHVLAELLPVWRHTRQYEPLSPDGHYRPLHTALRQRVKPQLARIDKAALRGHFGSRVKMLEEKQRHAYMREPDPRALRTLRLLTVVTNEK